jgi:maltoporin
MRRALQVSGLSGLLVTAFVSTHAFAEEPTDADAQQPTEEARAGQPAQVSQQTAAVVPTAAVVAPAAAAPAAKAKVGDVSTSGYFRAGFGANLREKGRQTCFQLNLGGLLSKYRLGNECEVWAEFELKAVVYAGEDGVVGNLHFMPVAFIPTTYIGYTPTGVTSSDLNSVNTGATVAFPNLYADIKGISWLFGGTAWSGTRYYKRESVYISDFFYWNPSGVGAGIEDVTLGKIWKSAPDVVRELTLSYGVFAVDGEPNGNNGPQLPMQIDLGVRNDVQIRGIRPYAGGEFQIGFQYIYDWSNDYSTQIDPNTNQEYKISNTHSGWGVTIRHVQQLLGGDNKVVFQYGVGGGTGFGTLSRFYYPDFSLRYNPDSEWRLRALDVVTIQPTSWLGLQANLVFQRDKNKQPSAGDWWSAGTRVSIAFVEHAKFLGEVGHDRFIALNGTGNRQLTKFTGALALAGGKGFWARPELRLYCTWAMWDKNAAISSVDSGKLYTYPDEYGVFKLSGSIVGLQAEAMW